MGEEAVLERRDGYFQLRILAQGGDVRFQLGRVVIALVDLVGIVKEERSSVISHIAGLMNFATCAFSHAGGGKIAGMKQRLRRIHLTAKPPADNRHCESVRRARCGDRRSSITITASSGSK